VAPTDDGETEDGAGSDHQALASVTYRRDGPAVLLLLPGAVRDGLLQQAGTAALMALTQHTDGVAHLVGDLVHALTERGQDGDHVLAEQLVAATGGPGTGRIPVPADLEMLADLLESDPMRSDGGHLDLATGEAWPQVAFDDSLTGFGDEEAGEDLDDSERWLPVPALDSREGWRDMRDFAVTCADPALAEDVLGAITGRGAFSRFRRALDDHPDHIRRWRDFREDRRTGRARSWLAHAGYDATPPRPL
jgi:hypothetical protein